MQFKKWLEHETGDLQAWLAGSVVTQPVYHGTNADFRDFKKMKTQRFVLFSAYDVEAQGFFFSESQNDALLYGQNLITAYIRLTNPLLDPRQFKHMGVDRFPPRKEAELAFILRHAIGKDNYYGKFIDVGVRRSSVGDDFARSGNYNWIYNAIGDGLHWDMLDKPKIVQAMKYFGYDGTFVHEPDGDETGRSIFVMDPSQIRIVSVSRNHKANMQNDDDFDDDYETY
jgi:hypothetical protein